MVSSVCGSNSYKTEQINLFIFTFKIKQILNFKPIIMKKNSKSLGWKKTAVVTLAIPLTLGATPVWATPHTPVAYETVQTHSKIIGVRQINPTTVEILFSNNQRLAMDFYGENIFRLFQDNSGGIIRDPEATPEARILVDNPRIPLSTLNVEDVDGAITISTTKVKVQLDKNTSLLKVINLDTQSIVLEESKPILFEKDKVTITLKENPKEYFYGGGVQNGRFSHKGKAIAIENQNSWTDGGVASPTPFTGLPTDMVYYGILSKKGNMTLEQKNKET